MRQHNGNKKGGNAPINYPKGFRPDRASITYLDENVGKIKTETKDLSVMEGVR